MNLKALLTTGLMCGGMMAGMSSFADQEMTPPRPLENKAFDAMMGTWEGDGDMMGKKMHDELTISWGLNHQFIVLDLKSTSVEKPGMNYEGKGLMGLDMNGKVKTWWFDSWGADAVATGTGSTTENKLEIQDGNAQFKETRSFEVNGNEMTMLAKGTMTMNGKEMPFDQKVVYKKK